MQQQQHQPTSLQDFPEGVNLHRSFVVVSSTHLVDFFLYNFASIMFPPSLSIFQFVIQGLIMHKKKKRIQIYIYPSLCACARTKKRISLSLSLSLSLCESKNPCENSTAIP
jgi:hypothetical protein